MFEAGDCIELDSKAETGAVNIRKFAAAITDQVTEESKKDIFSIIHGSLDLIMKKSMLKFGEHYHLENSESSFYFKGQQFKIMMKDQCIGSIGVVHPAVLRKFGWGHPIAMWEINITPLFEKF